MNPFHRFFLTFGMVVCSGLAVIDRFALHATLIGLAINLAWLWMDWLEAHKHSRRRPTSKEKEGDAFEDAGDLLHD